MKKLLYCALPCFCLILLAGCQSQDDQQYKYNHLLPLDVGNSWTYQVTRYDGFNTNDMMTATSTIKDTVTQVESDKNFWVVTMESAQSAESLLNVQGNYPVENMLTPAQTNSYWLIVDGNRIIHQEQTLNLEDLQNQALVELVFPLKLGSKWSMLNSPDEPLNDEVKKVSSIKVPAGEFSDCSYAEGTMGGTTFAIWFCPGIGIVSRSVEHHGTPFGYTQELMSYEVK